MTTAPADPVEAVTEADARGATAAIFADIRDTLGVDVVNLIWRHLATMPGALEWVWVTLKPLYLGPARDAADDLRRALSLPAVPAFSADTLSACGLDDGARAGIRSILESYYHTNALALVVLSAFLARAGNEAGPAPLRVADPATVIAVSPRRVPLPRLIPLSELTPPVARMVDELNRFGEDSDVALVASMYRHLSHWPAYLALVRTLLMPLHDSGELLRFVGAARRMGQARGEALAALLPNLEPPPAPVARQATTAVRRFVEHPIARMTGICALMRSAMPE